MGSTGQPRNTLDDLLFFRALQTRGLRYDHPHGHYNAKMKHIWQCNMAHLHDLVEEASTIYSSMTGVDYNYDDEHEDDDAIPSLLVFEPQ